MMSKSCVFVSIVCIAHGLQVVPSNVDMTKLPTAFSAVEKVEFGLVDEIFVLAQTEMAAGLKAKAAARFVLDRAAAEAKVNGTKVQVNGTKAKVNATTLSSAPASAPSSAPGAPSLGAEGGDRIPATGPAWTAPEAYSALDAGLKAAILPKFQPLCAAKLEEMVGKKAAYLAKHGASNSTLGHSMATHFQVTCEGAFPVKEKQCDDMSVHLFNVVDSGAPLGPPAAPAGAPGGPGAPGAPGLLQIRALRAPKTVAPAGAPAGPASAEPTESGMAWCGAFFNMYFDALINPAGGPAGAPAAF